MTVATTEATQRTRTAILDAAAIELARNAAASLTCIAATAGVGRATLHRHFGNRAQLWGSLMSDSWQRLHTAVGEAGLGEGSALATIDRLIVAMVNIGDRMLFLFAATDGDVAQRDSSVASSVDRAVIQEIRRGQRTGEIDPTVKAEWIERVIWSTVYTGLHAARDGLIPRHGVSDLIRWTLRGAITARATPRATPS